MSRTPSPGYATRISGDRNTLAATRAAAAAARPPRERLWRLQQKLAPYLFLSPFVILFCCFMIYPLGRSIILSLHKSVGPGKYHFVGLGNFRYLLSDRIFWASVGNTTYFTTLFLLLQVPIALALAVMLNSRLLKFRNFFRFAFFSSHLVGMVFVAIIFSLMLAQRHGLINKLIGLVLPFVGTELNWFADPKLAMPAVVIAALWISVGYAMVYLLAALQSVDQELYEAAQVDGASKWQQFCHVTLPGIRPVLIFLILVGTIGGYQLFELPYVLFHGVWTNYATTIVTYLFQMGFEAGDIGYASAIGWALVVIIFLISLIQIKVARAREDVA